MMTTSKTAKVQFSSGMSFVTSGNVTVTHAGAPVVKEEEELPGGYHEGFEAGVAQASAEAQAIIDQLNLQIEEMSTRVQHLAETIPQALNESLAELEQQAAMEAIELGFMAAERIVTYEIEKETPIRFAIAEALDRLTHLNGVRLMLSPADFELLSTETGAIPPGIELVQDASLHPGELFLESPQGFLDGKLHTRIAELRDNFMELMSQTGSNNAQTD